MIVRDVIHALEQMPEWHEVYFTDGPDHVHVSEVVENVNVGGVVIR